VSPRDGETANPRDGEMPHDAGRRIGTRNSEQGRGRFENDENHRPLP
jgi:hypothetical protein